MTVKDLRDLLGRYPADMRVLCTHGCDGDLRPIVGGQVTSVYRHPEEDDINDPFFRRPYIDADLIYSLRKHGPEIAARSFYATEGDPVDVLVLE